MIQRLKKFFKYHSWLSRAGFLLFLVGFFLMLIAYQKGIQILLFIPALTLTLFSYALWDYFWISRNVRFALREEHGTYYLKLFFPKNKFLQFNLISQNSSGHKHFVKLDTELAYQFDRENEYSLTLLVFGRFNIFRNVYQIGNIHFSKQKLPFEYFLVEKYQNAHALRSVDPLKTSFANSPYVRQHYTQRLYGDGQGNMKIQSPVPLKTLSRFRRELLHSLLVLIACIGIAIEWQDLFLDVLLGMSIAIVVCIQYFKIHLAEKWKNLIMVIAFVCMLGFTVSKGDMSGPGSVFLTQILIFLRLFPKGFQNSFFYIFLSLFVLVAISLFSNQIRYIFLFALYIIISIALFFSISGNESFDDEIYTFSTFHSTFAQSLSIIGMFICITVLYFLIPHGNKVEDAQTFGDSNSDSVISGFNDKIELENVKKISEDTRKIIVIENTSPGEIAKLPLRYFVGQKFDRFENNSWIPVRSYGYEDLPTLPLYKERIQALQMTYFLVGGKNIFLPAKPLKYEGERRLRPMVTRSSGDIGELLYKIDEPAGMIFSFLVDKHDQFVARTKQISIQKSTEANTKIFNSFLKSLPESAKKTPFALSNYIKNQAGFTYSINDIAGNLGDFLYIKKQGHCEYFATTLAVTLQRLGYDALLVNGYAVGEYNDIAKSLVLRANNAHAWVEVWDQEKKKRVILDPTPSTQDSDSLLKTIETQIEKRYDYLDIKWYTTVASYTQYEQILFYYSIFLFLSDWWWGIIIGGMAGGILFQLIKKRKIISTLSAREYVGMLIGVAFKQKYGNIEQLNQQQKGWNELFYGTKKYRKAIFLKNIYSLILKKITQKKS